MFTARICWGVRRDAAAVARAVRDTVDGSGSSAPVAVAATAPLRRSSGSAAVSRALCRVQRRHFTRSGCESITGTLSYSYVNRRCNAAGLVRAPGAGAPPPPRAAGVFRELLHLDGSTHGCWPCGRTSAVPDAISDDATKRVLHAALFRARVGRRDDGPAAVLRRRDPMAFTLTGALGFHTPTAKGPVDRPGHAGGAGAGAVGD